MILELAFEQNLNHYISFNTETKQFETESEYIDDLGQAIQIYLDIINGDYSSIDDVFLYPANLTKAIEILTK